VKVISPSQLLELRLERIGSLSRLGGKLGTASPAQVAFLLAVSKSRVRALLKDEKLPLVGSGGWRLIPLGAVLRYAKSAGKRVAKMRRSERAVAA